MKTKKDGPERRQAGVGHEATAVGTWPSDHREGDSWVMLREAGVWTGGGVVTRCALRGKNGRGKTAPNPWGVESSVTPLPTCVHTHYTQMHTHACTRKHARMCTRTSTYKCMRPRALTNMHAQAHMCPRTNAGTRTALDSPPARTMWFHSNYILEKARLWGQRRIGVPRAGWGRAD